MERFVLKLKDFFSFWKGIWAREIAASLALYFVLGFVPGMCLVAFILSDKFSLDLINDSVLFKNFTTLLFQLELSAKKSADGAGIFFICVSVYSAVNLFYRFMKCGEILYNFDAKDNPLKKRWVSFVFLALTVTFLSAAAVCYVSLQSVLKGIVLNIAAIAVLAIVAFLVLICLNFLVCPFKLSLREVVTGCVFTLILWFLISVGFFVYLECFANYERLYGIFGSVFALIFFVYLLMQAFTFGIAVNIKRMGRIKCRKKV